MSYLNGGIFDGSGEWIHGKRCLLSNELIYVLRGEVYLTEDGTDYTLRQDDVLLLERGKTHFGTRKSRDVSFFWFHFTDDCPIKTLHADGSGLSVMIRQLFHYENSGRYPRETLDLMLRLIFIEMEVSRSGQTENTLVNRVCEWVRANSYRKITVAELSERFKYNPDYLSRIVKAACRMPLDAYIKEQRMAYIKKMLLSGDGNMGEIAERCGFESYQTFLKFFTYHEHVSPTEYRNLYGSLHINSQ